MKKYTLITFEMAKKAKKAGLRIPSNKYYNESGELKNFGSMWLDFNTIEDVYTAITYAKYTDWINKNQQL